MLQNKLHVFCRVFYRTLTTADPDLQTEGGPARLSRSWGKVAGGEGLKKNSIGLRMGGSPRPLTWIRHCLRPRPHESGNFWNSLPSDFGPHETDPSESPLQKCMFFKLQSRMLILFVLDPKNLRVRVDDWNRRFSNSNKYHAFSARLDSAG